MTAVERILSTNSAGDEMVPFLCSWAMLLKSDPTATFFRTEPDFVEMCGFNVYFLHTWAFKSSNFLSTCLYLIKAAVIFCRDIDCFRFFPPRTKEGGKRTKLQRKICYYTAPVCQTYWSSWDWSNLMSA